MTRAAGTIFGRTDAVGMVERFLSERDRLPGALLIRGDAGIGKTTVWRAGLAAAQGEISTVLGASPTEAETKLAFAAVADLLEHELTGVLEELEPPQRRALRAALLLEDEPGAAPDERRVAAAFLAALRALAARGPLLVAIDDLQWLDPPSAGVIAFALRRLGAAPVGFLLTERLGAGAPLPLGLDRAPPELPVTPVALDALGFQAVRALLHERFGEAFARPVLRRVHEMSAGNPFAAIEIGEAILRGGGTDPRQEFAVPPTLHGLASERLAALPRETRSLLPTLAALSAPTLARLRAALDPDEAVAGLDGALRAGVVLRDGERLRFTHPLLASAAYSELSAIERERLHRRLAESTDDPEERGRHLALVAHEPEARIAHSVEVAAEVALRRGASDAAAGLYERARALTPPDDADSARRRLIQEARCRLNGGDTLRAKLLLEAAAEAADAGAARAELMGELSRVYQFGLDWSSSAVHGRRALEDAPAGSPLRAQVEFDLACTEMLLDSPRESIAHAHEAAELAEALDDEVLLAQALGVEARGRALLGDVGYEAVAERALTLESADVPVLWRPSDTLATVHEWRDDLDAALAALRTTYALARERGEETPQTWTLARISRVLSLVGEWPEALDCAREADDRAVDAGQRVNRAVALASRALAETYLGQVDSARDSAAEAMRVAGASGAESAHRVAPWALGLLDLSLGRAEAANRTLAPIVTAARATAIGEPGAMRFVPDQIEALVELGDLDAAEELLHWYERVARSADRMSALALAARCRGLLAAQAGQPEAALAAIEEALALHAGVPLPFERARTLLALGSARRRARERRAAREALEEAATEFERLGARLWSERAHSELGRVGGRAPGGDGLTPNEARVAGLVAEGRTNKEVAAALFLSPKTVEFHLRNVFRKLGVRSRTELSRRLPETADH